MKNIFFLIVVSCVVLFVSSTSTGTKSKSQAYLKAESLLGDFLKLNERAEKYQATKFGNFKDIEKESDNLNVRYDDLLKVFTDPSFIEKSSTPVVVKQEEKKPNLKN